MHFAWTVLFVTAAGCSFSPNAVQQGDDDAGTHGSDGEKLDAGGGKVYLDAASKVYMDAPCADVDHDGICDDVDDWLCGPTKPTAPASSIELVDNGGRTDFTLTNIALTTNLTTSATLVTAGKNMPFTLKFHIVANDSACSDCQDQLEIGWDPNGSRIGCAFDHDVPSGADRTFDVNTNAFRTPNASGVFELRMKIGQRLSCNDQNPDHTWYGAEPPENQTIALLCVP